MENAWESVEGFTIFEYCDGFENVVGAGSWFLDEFEPVGDAVFTLNGEATMAVHPILDGLIAAVPFVRLPVWGGKVRGGPLEGCEGLATRFEVGWVYGHRDATSAVVKVGDEVEMGWGRKWTCCPS